MAVEIDVWTFNKIVRTACGGFLLMLTGAISGAR
jgi:hypothetical protein